MTCPIFAKACWKYWTRKVDPADFQLKYSAKSISACWPASHGRSSFCTDRSCRAYCRYSAPPQQSTRPQGLAALAVSRNFRKKPGLRAIHFECAAVPLLPRLCCISRIASELVCRILFSFLNSADNENRISTECRNASTRAQAEPGNCNRRPN